jgi:hypothetical protein
MNTFLRFFAFSVLTLRAVEAASVFIHSQNHWYICTSSSLKGQCHEIFDPRFFSFLKTSVQSRIKGLKPFCMPMNSNSRCKSKFSICMRWHLMHGACGISETAYTMHAGSLTPHAQCGGGGLLSQPARCMRCHWHCMHKWNFWTTSTIEILRQNGFTIQKKWKMHAVSMTSHAIYDTACTLHNQRTIRAAFKGNI